MKYLILILAVVVMASCNKTTDCPTLVGYEWEFVHTTDTGVVVVDSGVVRCEDDPYVLFNCLKHKHGVGNNGAYAIRYNK